MENIDTLNDQITFYNFQPVLIYDKHFLNGKFVISKHYSMYNLKFYVYDYYEIDNKIIMNQDYYTLSKLLNDLCEITNSNEVYYCSINDYLYVNENEFQKRDRKKESRLFLRNILEECCVCNTYNTIKTVCNHNLCRLCFSKCLKEEYCQECDYVLEKIVHCPMCRKEIYKDCKLSYLN